ncbi:hypothetical protein T08_1519 [Trichinella sp. T8]|nr:hypothetical protein T08_1519 [Trichinella sp. T8]
MEMFFIAFCSSGKVLSSFFYSQAKVEKLYESSFHSNIYVMASQLQISRCIIKMQHNFVNDQIFSVLKFSNETFNMMIFLGILTISDFVTN